MNKKYYWDNDALRSTTAKVTKNYVYTKNSVHKNNLGTIYKTKKSAIQGRIKKLRNTNKLLEIEIFGRKIAIKYNNEEITKLQQQIARKSKR